MRTIPARLRSTAFAVAADLVLADGKMERLEHEFLHRLALNLRSIGTRPSVFLP